jgi:hypothetical protein
VSEVNEASGVARRLARDHWVRVHGTPRVTVLAGGSRARAVWDAWVAAAGVEATLLGPADPLDSVLRDAFSLATREPSRAVAVHAAPEVLARWRASAPDRLRTLVDEGLLAVDERASVRLDARSAAEAIFFEALEATPATAGRFELNGRLAIRFGPDAAEVDLLSRRDQIAIEIDGYHHFSDAERYRRDRRKDLLLQAHGLLVVRLLAEDVMRDPITCVNTVCQALAARRRT